MAITGLNAELMKRNRPMQITPIQAPPGRAPKDEPSALQRASKIALDRGMDTAVDEGGKMAMKYGKPLFEKGMSALMPSATPIAQAGTGMSPQMASAIIGSGSKAAPLVANQAGATMSTMLQGGAPAMAEAGLAASGSGIMGSLGGMGAAAMASPLAPIVGGLAMAKMLGFLSNGGQVGPLSAAQYKEEGGQVEEEKDTGTKILEELEEQLRKKKAAKEDRSTLLPSFRSLGGDISKVEYKSAGGETYKLFYGGGPLSKGA
jgi:hypothetical protein